jgi:hypothetical protein
MASVVWVATKQIDDHSLDLIVPPPDSQAPIEAGAMGAVGVDPITFQVTPLSDSIDRASLEGFNAPEQLLERANLVLLANDSDQYFKWFPKTRDELIAEERANLEIRNPPSYSEKVRNEPNQERVNEMIRSLNEILDPVAYHANGPKAGVPDRRFDAGDGSTP